ATADMLRQAPTYSTGIEKELATPTGAAILAGTTTKYGPMPMMTVAKIGYGAGSAELAEQANVLRIFVGEACSRETAAGWDETVTVIEANVDDMNPQIYGYFAQKAFEAGALDVFSTPVQMKKNRPGLLVTMVCAPATADTLVELIFRETTTIGVRAYEARRRILARETVSVETPHGVVRMKIARRNGHVLNAAPEYDDCSRIAAERGVPLKQVIAEAALAFEKQREK
ncbi:MAG: LarC family nickel insertion protein, partial [Acidobacteria bacterium]|nr:LarC family nickel insertion protein [Acidobacteriota bacterium]